MKDFIEESIVYDIEKVIRKENRKIGNSRMRMLYVQNENGTYTSMLYNIDMKHLNNEHDKEICNSIRVCYPKSYTLQGYITFIENPIY